MELTSPDKHIKIHLHVEQFTQKTNRKLGKRTPIQLKWQERFPHNWVGWERSTKLGPPPLEGIWKEDKVRTGEPSSWGVSRLSHRLGIPVPGCYTEETSLAGCWENCWGRQKGWRSLNSVLEERTRAGLPTIRVERALRRWLPPRCTPESKQGEHPGPCSLHSTSWHKSSASRTLGKDSFLLCRDSPGGQG